MAGTVEGNIFVIDARPSSLFKIFGYTGTPYSTPVCLNFRSLFAKEFKAKILNYSKTIAYVIFF